MNNHWSKMSRKARMDKLALSVGDEITWSGLGGREHRGVVTEIDPQDGTLWAVDETGAKALVEIEKVREKTGERRPLLARAFRGERITVPLAQKGPSISWKDIMTRKFNTVNKQAQMVDVGDTYEGTDSSGNTYRYIVYEISDEGITLIREYMTEFGSTTGDLGPMDESRFYEIVSNMQKIGKKAIKLIDLPGMPPDLPNKIEADLNIVAWIKQMDHEMGADNKSEVWLDPYPHELDPSISEGSVRVRVKYGEEERAQVFPLKASREAQCGMSAHAKRAQVGQMFPLSLDYALRIENEQQQEVASDTFEASSMNDATDKGIKAAWNILIATMNDLPVGMYKVFVGESGGNLAIVAKFEITLFAGEGPSHNIRRVMGRQAQVEGEKFEFEDDEGQKMGEIIGTLPDGTLEVRFSYRSGEGNEWTGPVHPLKYETQLESGMWKKISRKGVRLMTVVKQAQYGMDDVLIEHCRSLREQGEDVCTLPQFMEALSRMITPEEYETISKYVDDYLKEVEYPDKVFKKAETNRWASLSKKAQEHPTGTQPYGYSGPYREGDTFELQLSVGAWDDQAGERTNLVPGTYRIVKMLDEAWHLEDNQGRPFITGGDDLLKLHESLSRQAKRAGISAAISLEYNAVKALTELGIKDPKEITARLNVLDENTVKLILWHLPNYGPQQGESINCHAQTDLQVGDRYELDAPDEHKIYKVTRIDEGQGVMDYNVWDGIGGETDEQLNRPIDELAEKIDRLGMQKLAKHWKGTQRRKVAITTWDELNMEPPYIGEQVKHMPTGTILDVIGLDEKYIQVDLPEGIEPAQFRDLRLRTDGRWELPAGDAFGPQLGTWEKVASNRGGRKMANFSFGNLLGNPRQIRADILRSVGVINDYWDAMREHLDNMWGSEKRGDLWPQLMKYITYRMPEPDFQQFDSRMRSGDIAGGIEMLLQESGILLLARKAQGKSYRVDEWEGQAGSEQLVSSSVITLDDPRQWLETNYPGWRLADLGEGEYLIEDPQVVEAGGYNHQVWIEPAEKAAQRKKIAYAVGETYEGGPPVYQTAQTLIITGVEQDAGGPRRDLVHYKLIRDGQEVPPLTGQSDWTEGSDILDMYIRDGGLHKVGSRVAGEVFLKGDPSRDMEGEPLYEGDLVNWIDIQTGNPSIQGEILGLPQYGLASIGFPVEQLQQIGVDQQPPINVPTNELKKMSGRQAQATEEEQAFADQIADQVAQFAGGEKDVGQIMELIKGKAFAGEEKDATMPGVSLPTKAGPMASRNVHVMELLAQGKDIHQISSATVIRPEVVRAIIRAQGAGGGGGKKAPSIQETTERALDLMVPMGEAMGGGGAHQPPSAAGAAQQMIKKIQPHLETPKQPSVPEQEPAGEAGW